MEYDIVCSILEYNPIDYWVLCDYTTVRPKINDEPGVRERIEFLWHQGKSNDRITTALKDKLGINMHVWTLQRRLKEWGLRKKVKVNYSMQLVLAVV